MCKKHLEFVFVIMCFRIFLCVAPHRPNLKKPKRFQFRYPAYTRYLNLNLIVYIFQVPDLMPGIFRYFLIL